MWGGCVGGRARHVGLMGMPMWPTPAAVQAVDFVVLVGRLLTLLHRPVMTKRRCDSRAVRTNARPLSTWQVAHVPPAGSGLRREDASVQTYRKPTDHGCSHGFVYV